MSDFNATVIEEFRANAGQVGGNFEGAPLLLLHSRGARTGEARLHPMMYLPDGARYLVAPRGQTQWVRNMRVAGGGELLRGRRSQPFHAVEVADANRDDGRNRRRGDAGEIGHGDLDLGILEQGERGRRRGDREHGPEQDARALGRIDQAIAAHIELQKGERSELAELAANIL